VAEAVNANAAAFMPVDSAQFPNLAPLQKVMLRDSLAASQSGHHVEQLEIRFSRGVAVERVVAAWTETVARTEALRISFLSGDASALSRACVKPETVLRLDESPPESWEDWLKADRYHPLLAAHSVPWRAVYWPKARRFIWTFHHALLDGRSIARIVHGFLKRADGIDAEALVISEWHAPSVDSLERAEQMFLEGGSNPQGVALFDVSPATERAVYFLGMDFLKRLESVATALHVTAATILTWSWGQTLTEVFETESVWVEQLRAGAPQAATAGFTMNLLPILIHRCDDGNIGKGLREFRARLLALREIEAVSPEDFPPGVFPDMTGPTCSVIMVERGTLNQQVGEVAYGDLIESLILYERVGETLMATAHLLPDLRLEVEGPGRRDLLERWIRVLEREILAVP
jgi:hypothetical protein